MSGYAELKRIGVDLRPIESWPGTPTPDDQLQWTPFGAAFSSTLEVLARELRALNARRVVLELDIQSSQIRLDGLPRAGAKLGSGGVILSFESDHGPLRYRCDRFVATHRAGQPVRGGDDWKENLRAIALGMEKLRAITRYGIADDAQQYRGYAELPSGIPMGGGRLCLAEALELLGLSSWPVGPGELHHAWRATARKVHPDHGGTDGAFARAKAAYDLLRGQA